MTSEARSVTFIEINDVSAIGYCRRVASELYQACGATADEVSAAELVVTELVSNIHRHVGEGVVHLVSDPDGPTLDIVAVDRGAGFDVRQARVDGFSTRGGPGLGLGAVQRAADRLEIRSVPDGGTIVHAGVGRMPDASPRVTALGTNAWREEVSGDGFFVHRNGKSLKLLVFDALGHGSAAYRGAMEILAAVRASNPAGNGFTLHDMEQQLGVSRGAVACGLEYNDSTGVLTFEGVGNICAVCLMPTRAIRIPFRGGMLGRAGAPSRSTMNIDTTTRVVLHTDGIEPRWQHDRALSTAWSDQEMNPWVFAAHLLRDFRNPRDDSLVVIVDLKPRELQ